MASRENSPIARAARSPASASIQRVGVIAAVMQLLKLPDGTVKVLVEGEARALIKNYVRTDDYFEAEASFMEEGEGEEKKAEGGEG